MNFLVVMFLASRVKFSGLICIKLLLIKTLGKCAEQDNATSCMGDSGGPLTMMQNGEKRLLGNVSWGHNKCASNGYPSAYSRNADPTANAWIKKNANLDY